MGLSLGLGLPARATKPFTISDLFGNGLYAGFDFTDLERTKVWGPSSLPLLQRDLIGTNVTASGQTVQLAFDKSEGVAVGSDLITNSAGVHDQNVGAPTGWTDSSNGNYQEISTVANAWYRYTSDWDYTSGNQGPHAYDGGGFVTPLFTLTFVTTDGQQVRYFRAASALTRIYIYLPGASVGTATNVSVRRVAGNHGLQATSGSRPAYTESGALRYLAFDGIDDHLVTPLAPAAEITLAACFRPANTAGNQRVIGAYDSTGGLRCYLQVDASGVLSGGWNTGAENVIKDANATSNDDTDVVGLLRANGTTVELWRNGVLVYQGAAAGSTFGTVPIMVGALNNSGSPSTYLTGRIYRAIAVQRYIPETMLIPSMRALGAGVVSF